MLFRPVIALALVASAFADPLLKRQGSNTNAAIDKVVSTLSIKAHDSIPTINTLQANHTANDNTVGAQVTDLKNAFDTATTDLQGISPSTGSNTTDPTDNDLGVVFGGVLSVAASGLSGLTTATVPSLNDFFATLDTSISASVIAFNAAAPADSATFVNTLLRDARQFFQKEGMTKTLTALGFPTS
ncbi:hypothetical protein D9758_003937 [Tetrapyrgos nigripes]|uniref:Uncharacterized protein n=1 Tax=Tetrapyrgos nigripes TaxID=182062 RepID=A0A8H5GLX1_9AGAR|nr:hypothetical protein D9758_003937 [Tetrapyrgos nigripes]